MKSIGSAHPAPRRRENDEPSSPTWPPTMIRSFVHLRVTCIGLLASATIAQSASDWQLAHALGNRGYHGLTYDEHRQCTVLFGGFDGGTAMTGTFERSDGPWLHRVSRHEPTGRTGHAFAYDRTRRVVVLFGGMDPQFLEQQDTWEWDGEDWRERLPTASPSPRRGAAMAYDGARQCLVLFGGGQGVTFLGDTWTWNGTVWQQSTPIASPGPRKSSAIAEDVQRQRVVLFGGNDITFPGPLHDTWEWDGTNWTQRQPVTVPSASFFPTMVHDAASQRVLLFSRDPFLPRTLAWDWNGVDWHPVVAATLNAPRNLDCLAYDRARHCVIAGPTQKESDTIEWNGTIWQQVQPATAPSRRSFAALTTDPLRQRVVLFGGWNDPWLQDTWEWDGSHWHDLTTTTAPTNFSGLPQIVYDSGSQRTVTFTGNATWEWDGATWTQRFPPVQPHVTTFALAADPLRGCVVLHGFTATSSETWEWRGGSWQFRATAHTPTLRDSPVMVHDPGRGRTVLFGGHLQAPGAPLVSDTWEYDGIDWTLVPANPCPDAFTAAYDPASRSVVTFVTSWPAVLQTWSWDGRTWTVTTSAHVPSDRCCMGFTQDVVPGRMLVFGGSHNGACSSETFWHGLTVPATSHAFGQGCSSTNAPELRSSEPQLGQWLELELLSAPSLGPCLFGLSFGMSAQPLGGGCTLYLTGQPSLQLAMTDGGGHARQRLAIPLVPSLRGGVLYAQAAALDPGAVAGVMLTAGRALSVGD